MALSVAAVSVPRIVWHPARKDRIASIDSVAHPFALEDLQLMGQRLFDLEFLSPARYERDELEQDFEGDEPVHAAG